MPTEGEIQRLIISDHEGNYYLLTRDMLESARVEGEQKREVEELVNKNSEVTGFAMPGQTTAPLSFFGSQLMVRGTCACSYAGCTTTTLRPR
jgi:hypothetical protein